MKMNHCLAAVALSCASVATAQAEPAEPFTQANHIVVDDVELLADTLESVGLIDGTIARLSVPDRARAFEANVPIDGEIVTIRMEPYSVRADNFRLIRQLPDGTYMDVEPEAPRTMRGEILEIQGSRVAGSIDEKGFTGSIALPDREGLIWVEPVIDRARGATREHHVFYNAESVLDHGGVCGTVEDDIVDVGQIEQGTARGGGDCGGICVAELACDMDVEWNNDFGGGGALQIEQIVNGLNMQYESQVGITHLITAIIERTGSPDSDPFTDNTPDAGALLNQFGNLWNSQFTDIDRDVAQLFTGKNLNGSTIGIATLGVICNTFNAYSLVQNFSSFACRTDLSAHELGHNWAAPHCSCPGNTMNPSITCANNFAQVTINTISNFRNSRSCLDAFEGGTTPLPFSDAFESDVLDTSKWTGIDGAAANDEGINEPSAPFSLNVEGADEIRSGRMDASLETNVMLAYQVQRTGNGNSTEAGDDLLAEYFNDQNEWVEINRHFGDGPDQTSYEPVSLALPADAQHDNLRIRFRNLSSNTGFDDWFVDDINVSSTAALPGAFVLQTPGDGETGVATSPNFNWTDAPLATSFTIIVDDDSDLSSPILDLPLSNSSFSNPGFQLPNNAEYFWSVIASNPNGSTTSTPAVSSFIVGTVEEACPGDCTNDGQVNFTDLSTMLGQFGTAGVNPGCDADDNGTVNFSDLTLALGRFGPCP